MSPFYKKVLETVTIAWILFILPICQAVVLFCHAKGQKEHHAC